MPSQPPVAVFDNHVDLVTALGAWPKATVNAS